MPKHVKKRKKSRSLSLVIFGLLLLASDFYLGAYMRKMVDESTPQGVVTAYFDEVRFGDRGQALDLWSLRESNRKTVAFLATDALLGYRGDISSVSLRKVDYFTTNGGPRLPNAEGATYAEITGTYRTFGGTKNFRVTLGKLKPDREVLGRRLAVWRLFMADLDPKVQ